MLSGSWNLDSTSFPLKHHEKNISNNFSNRNRILVQLRHSNSRNERSIYGRLNSAECIGAAIDRSIRADSGKLQGSSQGNTNCYNI